MTELPGVIYATIRNVKAITMTKVGGYDVETTANDWTSYVVMDYLLAWQSNYRHYRFAGPRYRIWDGAVISAAFVWNY
ncbi:hypothetical protein KL86SPO_20366 [uncultured Sporomusa sp.]|uniref:Uncharacterized protein n=1 Tax=uncultured Sporomusa sp. TaxID=307249 RepID=A0A212LNB6_9FIRM|nr:hypothetical protein KL86SPO_20366 [uncultured Sporomusa sp.]